MEKKFGVRRKRKAEWKTSTKNKMESKDDHAKRVTGRLYRSVSPLTLPLSPDGGGEGGVRGDKKEVGVFWPTDLNRVKDTLIYAALEAGKILKEHFRSEKVEAKTKSSHADLVTNVDLKTQKAVIQILSRDLPGVQIIGEEKENEEASGEVIYVDPLDGTLNFFHGQRQFAVSLGYWVDRMPAAGVVFNPVDEDLFVAASGQGAFRNGRPIRVSPYRRLSQSVLATGWPYDKKELPRVLRSLERLLPVTQEVRVWGTAALALCYLAAGALEGYWEWGLYPWDIAAGVVIAREAGCRITSIDGGPFELSQGAILATNGLVHEEMLEYLTEEAANAEFGFRDRE